MAEPIPHVASVASARDVTAFASAPAALSTRPAPPDPDASDEQLVAQVAAGSEAALALLYDRHATTVWSLARAIVGEGSDADDVVAGAFAQLWRTAARHDASRGTVAAWLTMITRSRALDLLRARRRRAALHDRAAAEDPSGAIVPLGGSAEAPDADAERAEVARAVRDSLATLPPAQRQAIELAFFHGLTHTELAESLGEPLGTVKTRIRTGLRRLRDALRPFVGGEAA